MIVVDTSIWIGHFRGRATPLDELLGTGFELLHPYVFGELLLGGLPRKGHQAESLRNVREAPVASSQEVAAFIGWGSLAATGIGYVDAHLLVSARALPQGRLLTSDRSLHAQAERLGIGYAP